MTLPVGFAVRPGQPDDWYFVDKIIRESNTLDSTINEYTWNSWCASDKVYDFILTDLSGAPINFAAIREISMAEWWLEGVVVTAGNQQYVPGFLTEVLAYFDDVANGIVRYSGFDIPDEVRESLYQNGFVNPISYTRIDSPARPTLPGKFKKLDPTHLEEIMSYLTYAPMHAINKFAEHHNALLFLNEEKVKGCLATSVIDVLGWIEEGNLRGIVILFLESFPPDRLYVGHLDAADTTTAGNMLVSLRGTAHQYGKRYFLWKMPLDLGMDKAISDLKHEQLWDYPLDLWERQIRV